ncbi:hypothetical protein H9L15_16405 (plasmid) [Sphingomonas daechungensis]|uniref:Uncharacterized protein n=1 Tax=Sphingomonas daechungensis TaxID=1176646 RepID=A0ABX6T4C0_9SPHN|nr:hypothetical protein [Sphingomonas daechungensis]QNP44644.1 hypothetical protein H9L15_16405 [Sphingomonas daechungensis]
MRNIDVAEPSAVSCKPCGRGTRIRAARPLIATFEVSTTSGCGIVKGESRPHRRWRYALSAMRWRQDQRGSHVRCSRRDPLDGEPRSERAPDREMVQKKANWASVGRLDASSSSDPRRTAQAQVEMSTIRHRSVKVEEALAQLANDLQTRPEHGSGWRRSRSSFSIIDRSAVARTLWQKSREAVIRRRAIRCRFCGKLGEVLKSMGTTLESDARIRAPSTSLARRCRRMSASYGGSWSTGVGDVRGWDAGT